MKKYAFFKYFINNRVFAGGGGAGRLVPIEAGVGCSIFSSDMFWGRGCLCLDGSKKLVTCSLSLIDYFFKNKLLDS